MAYQAIYRKWRPTVFEDIIGQKHVTRTLRNQIINDRVSHAYLFCGTRGTGKTTAAKVFSRAVNCLNPKDGSPCNECEICRGILDGSILDVSEIDAASNNGVDNIREIREDVNYVAAQTKYRVYIIDEVHMLSGGAFNALLKTLEEPPAHVIFILATTEAHKVPETILSRCQRFDFKRITPGDIILRMREIALGDGLEITEDAYSLLARLADGSMRDGLSILERCVSSCGNKLSYDDIVSVLGIAEDDMLFDLADKVLDREAGGVLRILDTAASQGKDLNVFAEALIGHFRDLLVCRLTENPSSMLNCSAEELVRLRSQAEKFTLELLSDAARLLTKAKAEARWVKNPRVIYELALIKLITPELDSSSEAVLARLSAVEEKAANGITVTVREEASAEKKTEEVKPKKEVSARLFAPIDLKSLDSDSPIVKTARSWEKIARSIEKKYPYVTIALNNRRITIDGEGILLLYGDEETIAHEVAVQYMDNITEEFQRYTGTGFIIKAVRERDVEDNIIDYWSVPEGKGRTEELERAQSSADPLDKLKTSFPEIVEIDKSVDMTPTSADSFEQTDIYDEGEEFLTDAEKNSEEADE